MLINYLKFLSYFQNLLNKHFENQSPYIKCKKGCAKCCQNGDYPFSEIELKFLKRGFERLDLALQKQILLKIKELLDEKSKFGEKEFKHVCPFLIDNNCSVYEYRGLVCRTFGLIKQREGKNEQMPFCAYEGLNYSEVIDLEKNLVTKEKIKEAGYNVEPVSYNIHYKFLTSEKFSKSYNFDYGQTGPLLDILAKDKDFTRKIN
jgi:Fe-S-cluster containining protein